MFACSDYKRLDEDLQAKLLWRDGIFLMQRKTQRVRAELFSLYGFYVEVFFTEEDEPLFIKPFKGVNRLDPYLDLISIHSVFEGLK